ncbi:MAG: DUF3489 domain-containing protein [Methylobacteriaceae bacterium]|nr:DUF3489 domain-containing protein [Methylobacteriaceae bacterium]
MTTIQLTKTDARILTEAAGQNGLITLPSGLKPATQQRLLSRFLRDGLAVESEGGSHSLTPAGYRVVGLEPPRAEPGSKKALVLELLRRDEGASLAELIEATGWLPHTTRAALSRIRSGGQELGKSSRPDGSTAYRLLAEPVSPGSNGRRASRPEAVDAASAAA